MFTRRQMMGAAAALSFLASTGAGVAQDLYIPLISKGFQHQFWQAVKAGADQAAAELGAEVTFEGPDNETMVDRQIDMLSAALARNPDAIGFAALDSQAATPLLRQAQEAGIPIVAFDSGVESDIPVATAATDNLAAAALAADKMAELIGVDSLAFISLDGLYRALGKPGRNAGNPGFCDACFTGDYAIPLTDQMDNAEQRGSLLKAGA